MLQKKSGNGTIIGIILVILLLLVGAYYVLKPSESDTNEAEEQNMAQTEAKFMAQDDSDELSSIESDLEATNFSEI